MMNYSWRANTQVRLYSYMPTPHNLKMIGVRVISITIVSSNMNQYLKNDHPLRLKHGFQAVMLKDPDHKYKKNSHQWRKSIINRQK